MQLVAVDILGPLPENELGNSYVLVAGDYFTRWMEAYAIPNQEEASRRDIMPFLPTGVAAFRSGQAIY